MTRVQSLRPSTGYDLDKMDLELKAMVTMRALAASPNPQHANMYTSLLLDKALTYETVKEMIAREFASHRMTADGTPLAANRAGYTPECYNCKGPHLIRDCPKFKPDWKKEEEAAAAASTSKRQGKKKKGGAHEAGFVGGVAVWTLQRYVRSCKIMSRKRRVRANQMTAPRKC